MKIISGGQTGVDRAALDFALEHKMPCGGFCPRGRLAEDGRIPDHYPLQETDSAEYAERTEKNILSANGTLILYSGIITGGTQYTYLFSKTVKKPLFLVNTDQPLPLTRFQNWMAMHKIRTLNIAGPRESQHPGIYRTTLEVLQKLILKST
ncbi:MAG: putative molybdenum carrier protein [bacterium]